MKDELIKKLENKSTPNDWQSTPNDWPSGEGMGAEQIRKTTRTVFWYPARTGWLKCLGLEWATPSADFAVMHVQLCLTIISLFPCVALLYKNCPLFHIIADYCPPEKRPMI